MIKKKLERLDFIKILNFCVSQNTIKKIKCYSTDLEEIFPNHISDKGFVSRIYKETLQLNNEKTTQFKNGLGS